MTDNELSGLLKEWKRTPAPPTLDARVFGACRLILPRWLDRVPASVTAFSGVAIGGLVVYGVIALASYQSPVAPKAPVPALIPVTSSVAPPADRKSSVTDIPRFAPKPLRSRNPSPPVASKPRDVPATSPAVTSIRPPVAACKKCGIFAQTLVFPPGAEALAVTTTVKLRLRIGKDGRVVEASVIDGDPVLNDAALEAVKDWTYGPYLLNGVPAEQNADVTVNFTARPPKVLN